MGLALSVSSFCKGDLAIALSITLAALATQLACERHENAPALAAPPPEGSGIDPPNHAAPPLTKPKETCPADMRAVPGGDFWMGRVKSTTDEAPRFRTRLRGFCLDVLEVTAAAYASCSQSGACSEAHGGRANCNTLRGRPKPGRENHPINCVDHGQAEAFCRIKGRRLPTELEWEYAARGGSQQLKYPWGDAGPEGRACWKHNGTCEGGAFGAGAFGLSDLTGNVWEWTQDWYGPYPWPALYGFHKVYRGGSFSRRFEKWLEPGLRNRESPEKWGSHLGFRCALSLKSEACPFGEGPEGECLHGLLEVGCPEGRPWNGLRCARASEPACGPGLVERPGFGCVLPAPPERPRASGIDTTGVGRVRSPEYDADCQQNQPGRAQAYRYTGATHAARSQVVAGEGCKNRDVGAGWNSACCP